MVRLIERIRAPAGSKHDDELRALLAGFDFEASLGSHRFGLYHNFQRFQLPEIRAARPQLVFHYFYPGLLLASLVAVGLIAIF
jgi:hypothetical protein